MLDSYHPRALSTHFIGLSGRNAQRNLLQLCIDETEIDAQHLQQLLCDVDTISFDELFMRCTDLKVLPVYLVGHSTRQVEKYMERLASHNAAMAHYCPSSPKFATHLFVAQQRVSGIDADLCDPECLDWSVTIPSDKLHIVPVAGDHQSMVRAHVGLLGKTISEMLEEHARSARHVAG
jgi:arthrofactin-type cyclic lipopeptide synthetase C